MAEQLTRNIEAPVTLAETVTQLTLADGGRPSSIVVWSSTVDVHVVVLGSATDGGALPATGRPLLAAASLPIEYDVSPFGFVGVAAVAGSGGGSARIELR